MYGTFNMGIGMALVCSRPEAVRVIRMMHAMRLQAWIIGTIERDE